MISLRELQSATEEELRRFVGRTLLPSAEVAPTGRGVQGRAMNIMSLRDDALPSKQSPVTSGDIVPFGDCLPYGYDVATCARNDMQTASLPAHAFGRSQSQTQEELRPLFGSPSGVVTESFR